MKSVVENEKHTNQRSTNRWLALVFLALAQFLVVLDSSIVNIALPSIGHDLILSTDTLTWVITAYIVPMGGLLLLGGRLADRFGHRRIFMIGVIGFIIGSTSAGMSASIEWLLVSRAIQGASAGFLAPSALALVTLLFTKPNERAKALGIWGIVAGLSGVGVLLVLEVHSQLLLHLPSQALPKGKKVLLAVLLAVLLTQVSNSAAR